MHEANKSCSAADGACSQSPNQTQHALGQCSALHSYIGSIAFCIKLCKMLMQAKPSQNIKPIWVQSLSSNQCHTQVRIRLFLCCHKILKTTDWYHLEPAAPPKMPRIPPLLLAPAFFCTQHRTKLTHAHITVLLAQMLLWQQCDMCLMVCSTCHDAELLCVALGKPASSNDSAYVDVRARARWANAGKSTTCVQVKATGLSEPLSN